MGSEEIIANGTDQRTVPGLRLSIIVPTYNCRDYIDECLSSIIDQMWEDSELIIVDDGSDDGSDRILEGYRDAPRVKVILRDHEGASGARNAGIEAASGEYLTFVDCDDRLKKGFLTQAENLLTRPADMIIFGFERIYLDGKSAILSVCDHFYPDVSSFADEYIRSYAMLIYSASNKFYNKKIIDSCNIRFETDIMFGEDRLFNYAFLCRAKTIRTSELIMFDYMQRSLNSMSSRHYPDFFRLLCRLHEEKMKCFLRLSEGTDREERESFVCYDMQRTVLAVAERFAEHPEEIDENLPDVLKMIYGDRYGIYEQKKLMNGDIPEPSQWHCSPCDSVAISDLI